MTENNTPTVVLVHGAFADASGFGRLIPELLADGPENRVEAVLLAHRADPARCGVRGFGQVRIRCDRLPCPRRRP
ncbi:hypothetical protein [Kitasatospora sp. CB02891]|uniref:hypothetical protein n=1 Tax=Kitasatospora sp. CB02891 TaxID=2020329 RepID=UPI000CBE7D7A|nr:hypothetical protein CG736_12625 [Kitasatospora sp. CB02891]